jgi:hypothetical protein
MATHHLSVAMYASAHELRSGLAKNLAALAGGTRLSVLLTATSAALILFAPLLAPVFSPVGWLALAALVVLRVLTALLFRDPPRTLLGHVPGAWAALALLADSQRRVRSGGVSWKGRVITTQRALVVHATSPNGTKRSR